MLRIGICGANGKIGKRIISLLEEGLFPKLKLGAAFVSKHSPPRGSRATASIRYQPVSEKAMRNIDVLIDFSKPSALREYSGLAQEFKKPVVIGTTGFSKVQKKAIEELSHTIPVVWSPNTSIGVNVLFQLVRKAVKLLPQEFSVHISETHHVQKKDAPSGTALELQKEIQKSATNRPIPTNSIRAGDVIGEHTVSFFGLGERLELTHRATSRDIFARGALQAAEWLSHSWRSHKKPRLYTMQDVLLKGEAEIQ